MAQGFLQFFPAISILFVMLAIIFLIVLRIPSSDVMTMLDQRGFVLIAIVAIFSLTLALHLYQTQDWTADLLKVVIGVIVGVSATKAASTITSTHQQIEGSTFGHLAQIAARDIHATVQKIESMQGNIEDIQNAVINQAQTIERISRIAQTLPSATSKVDYFVAIAPDGTDDRLESHLQNLLPGWAEEGWRLTSVSRGSGPSWIYTLVRESAEPTRIRVEWVR